MALKLDLSTPESYQPSLEAMRRTLDQATLTLFDEAIMNLPRLSLEYYQATKANDTIKEVLRLMALGDGEIIFNTRQNFFHGKNAIQLIAAYWAIIKEIDYCQKHTHPDLAIAYDYDHFNQLYEKLPTGVKRKIIFTTTLRTLCPWIR